MITYRVFYKFDGQKQFAQIENLQESYNSPRQVKSQLAKKYNRSITFENSAIPGYYQYFVGGVKK